MYLVIFIEIDDLDDQIFLYPYILEKQRSTKKNNAKMESQIVGHDMLYRGKIR